jgi:hypothetical protein
VPFGPFTVTVLLPFALSSIVMSTPPGTVMGELPIRDMSAPIHHT